MNLISLECDICGENISAAELGFVKNPRENEKVVKCKGCHEVDRPQKESSYITL